MDLTVNSKMTPKQDLDAEKKKAIREYYDKQNGPPFGFCKNDFENIFALAFDAGRASVKAEVEALKAENDKLKASTLEAIEEALNAAKKKLGWW